MTTETTQSLIDRLRAAAVSASCSGHTLHEVLTKAAAVLAVKDAETTSGTTTRTVLRSALERCGIAAGIAAGRLSDRSAIDIASSVEHRLADLEAQVKAAMTIVSEASKRWEAAIEALDKQQGAARRHLGRVFEKAGGANPGEYTSEDMADAIAGYIDEVRAERDQAVAAEKAKSRRVDRLRQALASGNEAEERAEAAHAASSAQLERVAQSIGVATQRPAVLGDVPLFKTDTEIADATIKEIEAMKADGAAARAVVDKVADALGLPGMAMDAPGLPARVASEIRELREALNKIAVHASTRTLLSAEPADIADRTVKALQDQRALAEAQRSALWTIADACDVPASSASSAADMAKGISKRITRLKDELEGRIGEVAHLKGEIVGWQASVDSLAGELDAWRSGFKRIADAAGIDRKLAGPGHDVLVVSRFDALKAANAELGAVKAVLADRRARLAARDSDAPPLTTLETVEGLLADCAIAADNERQFKADISNLHDARDAQRGAAHKALTDAYEKAGGHHPEVMSYGAMEGFINSRLTEGAKAMTQVNDLLDENVAMRADWDRDQALLKQLTTLLKIEPGGEETIVGAVEALVKERSELEAALERAVKEHDRMAAERRTARPLRPQPGLSLEMLMLHTIADPLGLGDVSKLSIEVLRASVVTEVKGLVGFRSEVTQAAILPAHTGTRAVCEEIARLQAEATSRRELVRAYVAAGGAEAADCGSDEMADYLITVIGLPGEDEQIADLRAELTTKGALYAERQGQLTTLTAALNAATGDLKYERGRYNTMERIAADLRNEKNRIRKALHDAGFTGDHIVPMVASLAQRAAAAQRWIDLNDRMKAATEALTRAGEMVRELAPDDLKDHPSDAAAWRDTCWSLMKAYAESQQNPDCAEYIDTEITPEKLGLDVAKIYVKRLLGDMRDLAWYRGAWGRTVALGGVKALAELEHDDRFVLFKVKVGSTAEIVPRLTNEIEAQRARIAELEKSLAHAIG